jgi:hypothetical protein
MKDGIKKTYFELKDPTGRAGKKKQNKVQVEAVFFKPNPKDNLTPDNDGREDVSKSEEEVEFISEADIRFLEMRRRGIFACPRFDNFWEVDDARIE